MPTGFARVLESIFGRLTGDFDIHHLGVGHSGDPHPLPWPVYPAGVVGDDQWGAHRIAALADWIKPDLIFMMNDSWVVSQWLEALAAAEHRPPVIAYLPVDAGPVDPRFVTRFDMLAHAIAYTHTAAGLLRDALGRHTQQAPGFRAPPVGVIPHGLDADTFHNLGTDARATARARIFADNSEFQNAFIVLNANRNQPRKRIDLTILGFAEFARGKPETVKLFLHMGARDLGWDIPELVRRYGIEDRTLMSTAQAHMPGVSEAHLNLVYNACDVGVNTAEAEGWGLVSHEHAATGAAQIVPGHTAYNELWDNAAIRLEPALTTIDPGTSTEARLIDPRDLAAALERCYSDQAYLAEMARRAETWARRPEFAWDRIAAQWRDIIAAALSTRV
ncbi:glycosyltransferase [Breoghania sp. L-A4]|uniref:glycosyltransferase n=1 Tax=Breoghania sp. L-A4 TaxID=2304600 RepID=UPI000E35B244|nr:glycosyltransferase [Breoghania sp. L-A4]AXS40818.1 glycosyltransferase family 1 protein [Breoghania sp. L-A4]